MATLSVKKKDLEFGRAYKWEIWRYRRILKFWNKADFDEWGVKMGVFEVAESISGVKMADFQFKMAEIGKKRAID